MTFGGLFFLSVGNGMHCLQQEVSLQGNRVSAYSREAVVEQTVLGFVSICVTFDLRKGPIPLLHHAQLP